MSDVVTTVDQRSAVRAGAVRAAGRQQLTVVAAQVVSGLGNLMFALVAVRVLSAESWARLAAFLAAMLLIGLPAASLTAAGALDPSWSQTTRQRWLRLAGGLSISLIAASVMLATPRPRPDPGTRRRRPRPASRWSCSPSTVASCSVSSSIERWPTACWWRHSVVCSSAECWPRCTGSSVRSPASSSPPTPRSPPPPCPSALHARASRRRPSLRVGAPTAAGLTFLVLGVLQTQDLFVANARLDGIAAAQFAVLSTLGGAAVFATATVPMVLLPQVKDGRPRATATAIGVTAACRPGRHRRRARHRPTLSCAWRSARGTSPIAALLPIYLLGMASLAVCRVVAARRCTTDPARLIRTCVIAAGLHLVALLALGRSPGSVVAITTLTMLGLGTALVAPDVLAVPSVGRRKDAIVAVLTRPTVVALAGLSAAALGLRVVMFRGLWVDEAISVRQARLPLGTMLHELAATDVHPPLHHLILWVTTRILGASEFAVRLPSILAGVALIPLLFWAGSLLYSRRVGWVAALLAVPSPLHGVVRPGSTHVRPVHGVGGRRDLRPGPGGAPRRTSALDRLHLVHRGARVDPVLRAAAVHRPTGRLRSDPVVTPTRTHRPAPPARRLGRPHSPPSPCSSHHSPSSSPTKPPPERADGSAARRPPAVSHRPRPARRRPTPCPASRCTASPPTSSGPCGATTPTSP